MIGFKQGVPDPIKVIFVARWMHGGATIDWFVAHPDWYEWADICSIAHDQAVAEKNKPET